MPELPEVETTRRGIAPSLTGHTVARLIVRDRRLRWPVPEGIESALSGERVLSVDRRAKYLLFRTGAGTAIAHLGMSGSMRIVSAQTAVKKHDHFDLVMQSGDIVRFNDPRRFGCLLWTAGDPENHSLLQNLGPEPLGPDFTAAYLHKKCRDRRIAIKAHIMNAAIVVGVGNIYANEALFIAGIHPRRAAGRIALARIERLVEAIKFVLDRSIQLGGTTLRDFYGGSGQPGYFRQQLQVYGRNGEPCRECERPIRLAVIGQRSTFYCTSCQR